MSLQTTEYNAQKSVKLMMIVVEIHAFCLHVVAVQVMVIALIQTCPTVMMTTFVDLPK